MADPAAPASNPAPLGSRLLLYGGFVLLGYAAWRVLEPVLLPVVLAAAVASLSFGLYRRAVRLGRGRARLAAALLVLAIVVVVLLPATGLTIVLLRRLVVEATELARALRDEVHRPLDEVAAHLGPLAPYAERALADLRPKLAQAVPSIAQGAGRTLAVVGGAVARFVIAAFLFVLALYYGYVDGDAWHRRLVHLVPLAQDDARALLDRFRQVSLAVLVGNLGTAAAQGAVAMLGYWLFGAPTPIVWGVVTLFAALVPVVGSTLVWVPLVLVVGVDRGWPRGIGLGVYCVLIVGTVDNLIRPLLTRRGLQLHPLLVFLAVFGGVTSFGFAGLFLGPLVVALAMTALDLYEKANSAVLS